MFYSDEILEKTKMLLGIDNNEKDNILSFIIDDTVDAVLAHCRIELLPKELIGVVSQMAVRVYRENGYGETERPREVQSISEGDRSISFGKRSNTDGILTDFKSRLKPFINRAGRLPSEVKRCEE